MSLLRVEAERLGHVAAGQELSLGELVAQLEDKHQHLISSPAIWPAQGLAHLALRDRASRPSPGCASSTPGIDIAGEMGTDVIAPAHGRVIFVGDKGPLGKTIVIDHGYGVRTHFGHNSDDHGARRPGGRARSGDREARLDRPQHGPAPALRRRGERQVR